MIAQRHRSAFTMLELSITMVIISMILYMSMTFGQNMIDSARRASTNSKLDQIEKSLMTFRTANNRLPCPADGTLANTNANYGVETGNQGSCTNGALPAKVTNTSGQPVASEVVEGAVPFKALGLPEEYMYDGWGRKFAYAVNYNVTASGAMKNQTLSDQCGITVNDASGNARTTGAIYALVSFGSDGHGGYLKSGTRLSAGSTNADEQHNCHCSSSLGAMSYSYTNNSTSPATVTATNYDSTYVQKDRTEDPNSSTDLFDDIVRYKTRGQMVTPDDMYNKGGSICQHGVRFDGSPVTSNLGTAIAIGDVNGDGIPDLVSLTATNGNTQVSVIFGTPAGFPNPLPIFLNGNNGFNIIGFPQGYFGDSGIAVADINGDGYGDIFVGTGNGGQKLLIDVIFGHANPWPGQVSAASLIDGTHGFQISAPSVINIISNYAVGDLNGDGIDDVVFAAYGNGVYGLFGHKGSWAATGSGGCSGIAGCIDPTTFTGANGGFIVQNVYPFFYAYGDMAIGDLNGDGIADLALQTGYLPVTGTRGAVSVLFGHTGTWTNPDISALNGNNGFYAYTTSTALPTGCQSVAIGDVNGDGIGDLISGCFNGATEAGTDGSVYIIWGHTGPWSAFNDYATLVPAGQAVRIDGTGSWGFTANAGSLKVIDLNGDGIGDVVMGCGLCTLDSPYGYVYVMFGHTGTWTSIRNLRTTPFTGTGDGVRFDCSYASDVSSGIVGCGVSRTAPALWWTSSSKPSTDINGDGISDLFIQTPWAYTATGSGGGDIYAVYGHRGYWPAVVKLNTIE